MMRAYCVRCDRSMSVPPNFTASQYAWKYSVLTNNGSTMEFYLSPAMLGLYNFTSIGINCPGITLCPTQRDIIAIRASMTVIEAYAPRLTLPFIGRARPRCETTN